MTFPPGCLRLCHYKLAAGYGNLWDQSQQAEKLRTQEMPWADSGCIKSPRCRSLLSKTRRVFWSGLDVWVCSWWTAQLENWEIIHIALGLKVLIWEGNAQGGGRESLTYLVSGAAGKWGGGERPGLVGNPFWFKVSSHSKPFCRLLLDANNPFSVPNSPK